MNSITPKPLNDFVAIDVEYANREQDICQIGLVVVRNLEIVEQRVWVIQPFDNHYDENFSRAHHMTEADTANAPTFDIVWLNEIRSYFLIGQLWAHNAISVEQPVLEKNFQEYDDHKTPEGAGCFSDCTGRRFLYSLPFRCVGYQGRFLSRTRVFECFLCPGISFPCCVRPVGFNEKKGKSCPDHYLRLRSPDRGAMLCFSI